MIVLNLACRGGHQFEGWFASAEAFRSQMDAGLVNCPHCGDADLRQLPSVPHVARQPRSEAAPQEQRERDGERLIRALRRLIDSSEDVGTRFPEEARRMHYEDVPARSIRGIATFDETRELLEEGIDVLPLPIPPKEETH